MPSAEKPLKTVRALAGAGLVAPEQASALEVVARRYAVAVTPAMLARMNPADPADPLARQFVPAPEELETTPAERADPIGDEAHAPVEGIVHRYPDRVLLKPLHVCPVYCRFCFRRERVGPGAGNALGRAALHRALAYIREHSEVWEVILSGGDPLMLAPGRLEGILRALGEMPHVAVARIHTRVPAVDPARVTPALVQALRSGPTCYVVLHANHARELGPEALAACARLVDGGVPMLGQTVLLRGVNDDAAVLEELFRTLVASRVKPYYLHHGDLAPGTRRFRTTLARGRELMRALRGRLSGIAQPTYVLDLPGGHGKVPAGPAYLHEEAPGRHRVTAPDGTEQVYTEDAAPEDTA